MTTTRVTPRFVADPWLLATAGLFVSGCGQDTFAPGAGSELSQLALTAEQCSYFAANDEVTFCHVANQKNGRYVLIKTSREGCVNGHSDHDEDFISLDGTCEGDACLPAGAPADDTIACCDDMEVVDSACACVAGTEPHPTDGTCTDLENDLPILTWSSPGCVEDEHCVIHLEAVDPDPGDTHTFTITDINTPGLSTLHLYDETAPNNVGAQITGGREIPDGRVVYVPAANFWGWTHNLFAASVEDQGGLITSGYSVSVFLAPQDDPPVAFDGQVHVFPHQIGVEAVPVDVNEGQLFGEADQLEIVITSLPAVGVLKIVDVEITTVGTAVPCGDDTCGAVFDYLLSAGTHTHESVVDSFEVRVRDVVGGGTSEPATVSVFLEAPIQTRLLSSSEWSYPEGGSVEMELTFEGSFATSMWLGILDWHNTAPVSMNDVGHSSGVVYADTVYRVGGFTDAIWEGSGELTSGVDIPSVQYAPVSCTTYTCTFSVTLRGCEGAEASSEAPCNPDHSGIDTIALAVTTEADSAPNTGQFGGGSAAVTEFDVTVDITNDFLDASPVMPPLAPLCTPDLNRVPVAGSGFLDSAGEPTTADLQHYWCADAVLSADGTYDVSVFGVGAQSDGLDASGDADAWRMEVTYYRAYTGSDCPAGGTCLYQRADVPGDTSSLSPIPPVITDLGVTLDEVEIAQLSGLTIEDLIGGYGFTVEHTDLLELRRALYYGIHTHFGVDRVPEHDALQARLYSRDPGTSEWHEEGTEHLLFVRDDSSLQQIVTAPDPNAYP